MLSFNFLELARIVGFQCEQPGQTPSLGKPPVRPNASLKVELGDLE